MTAEAYEYYLRVFEYEQLKRNSESLWRRPVGTEAWQYLSLWDWEWHGLADGERQVTAPQPEHLRPVPAERAMELAADRSRWCLYWARFREEPKPGERPRVVVRRKPSPEREQDQVFGRDNEWVPSTALFDAFDPRQIDVPYLVPIEPAEAERIIQETRGISGATSW